MNNTSSENLKKIVNPNKTAKHILFGLIFGFSALSVYAKAANALPTGQSNIQNATISTSGNTMDINQSADRAAINWEDFNIETNETVNFHQTPNQAILNRVTGNTSSNIFGTLNADGNVLLINPNGILFGNGANINVGSLFASTSDLSASEITSFINGQNILTFSQGSNGSINVEEGATITAENSVILASGHNSRQSFNLDISGGLWSVNIAEVNLGDTVADLISGVVNVDGTIVATSAEEVGGNILLVGDEVDLGNTALLDASGANQGGFIETSGNTLNLLGSVDTSSVNGETGTWLIDPEDITIDSTLATTIEGNLTSSNIEVTTSNGTGGDGNITLDADINSTSGNDLTLTAYGFFVNEKTGGGPRRPYEINLTGDLTFNLNAVNSTDNYNGAYIQNALGAIGTVNETTINLTAGNSGTVQVDFASGTDANGVDYIGGLYLNDTGTLTINGIDNKIVTVAANSNPASGITTEGVTGGGVYNYTTNTVLDGNGTNSVFTIAGNSNVTLNGLTIQNGGGSPSGTGGSAQGGGIQILDADTDVHINYSVIRDNSTTSNGGGIFNAGDLWLHCIKILDNLSGSNGGGIYNSNGNVWITLSEIENNQANAQGGGIYSGGSASNPATINIDNSTIYNNAVKQGGGI